MPYDLTGNHAYCRDCAVALAEMPDNCIDLTVTSPPYDNLRLYNGFTFEWHEVISQLHRVTKQGGVVVWIVSDATVNGSESGTSFRQALYAMDCGFNLYDTMIFAKNNPVPKNHLRYEQAFEYMFVLTKGNIKTFNPIKIPCEYAGKKHNGSTFRNDGKDYLSPAHKNGNILDYKLKSNIWFYSVGNANKGNPYHHSAVFPLQLAKDCVISFSDSGDIVLDPFLGSGTTRIAAYELNRKFVGFEISEEYFRMQEKRFADYTAQTSLFH